MCPRPSLPPSRYTYDREVFVWPFVQELKAQRRSAEPPAAHLDVMRAFVTEYSGVCNFNYKVRASGDIAIFEVNTRVGGDLAEDVPRGRARAFFERLEHC